MRKYINSLLIRYFKKFDEAFLRSFHPYYSDVIRTKGFDEIYDYAIKHTQTKESLWRRDRFYNLYSSLELVQHLNGDVMELGCYKGLSSYLLCTRLRELNPMFTGEGYSICDSFEGLSNPTDKDQLNQNFSRMFAAPIEVVKKNLDNFPGIKYHKGWIPNVFKDLSGTTYRFVHIDVDLVEPTMASFEYFYPRLVSGGIIVCDDYGGKIWESTKKAVDVFCATHNCQSLRLSTGQIMIFKK